MGRRTKAARCFPAAAGAHWARGLPLPRSWRLPAILHQNPLRFPYAFLMFPALHKKTHCSHRPFDNRIPTTCLCHTEDENPKPRACRARPVDAGHRCQLRPIACWLAPPAAEIPALWCICLVNNCYFPRSSQSANMPLEWSTGSGGARAVAVQPVG